MGQQSAAPYRPALAHYPSLRLLARRAGGIRRLVNPTTRFRVAKKAVGAVAVRVLAAATDPAMRRPSLSTLATVKRP